jgi:hypothetical protein
MIMARKFFVACTMVSAWSIVTHMKGTLPHSLRSVCRIAEGLVLLGLLMNIFMAGHVHAQSHLYNEKSASLLVKGCGLKRRVL